MEHQPPVGGDLPAPDETPIIIVDSEPSVLSFLEKALEDEGYPVEAFDSAQAALERIASASAALMISDIQMPDMGAMELIRRALEEDPNLAIIVLTGAADAESAIESLRLGVDDYLEKPITVEGLIESVTRALRRRAQADYRHKLELWLRDEVTRRTEEVQRQSQQLELVTVATLSTLVRAMEAKDPYLKGHSERVARLCAKMALHMGFEERDVDDLRTAGLLHDLGMIAIPDSITHKQSALTEDEYRRVQEHVQIGVDILKPLPHLARSVSYIAQHHERLDGSGYPEGLREIPLASQILGLAEHFASLTEVRPHRQAYAAAEALEQLTEQQDTWFEVRAIDALQQVIKNEPGLGESEWFEVTD
ncbi:MAG: response regulator [Gemmatimonadota bacterium]|nr:MAG: response regulator [Gemmatimonadota bacterium]